MLDVTRWGRFIPLQPAELTAEMLTKLIDLLLDWG